MLYCFVVIFSWIVQLNIQKRLVDENKLKWNHVNQTQITNHVPTYE